MERELEVNSVVAEIVEVVDVSLTSLPEQATRIRAITKTAELRCIPTLERIEHLPWYPALTTGKLTASHP
jgi:hypothetical protein